MIIDDKDTHIAAISIVPFGSGSMVVVAVVSESGICVILMVWTRKGVVECNVWFT